ncbi:exocyst complex component EXO70E2-like [Papaver somniferum]|uniref:exocyst complex component EXO70E2-like n=1 Tax=Papaver somniferum TaxID=3469 RepID=UPI000E6FDD8B|nr:exocyst complex component EXO70E2-like [Papaver somniferum]
MADHKSAVEGEKHLVAAALHIVRALGAHKNLEDDCRKLLVDLDIKLSAMTLTSEENKGGGGLTDIENWMNSVEMKVNSWVLDKTFVLNCSLDEASEYFELVEQVLGLADNLASFPFNDDWKKKELLHQAHTVLHFAMVKLEEEFSHILVKNRQFLETEKGNMSVCLCRDYDQECTLAYIRNRRVALAEVLFRLDMERMSIDELVKMDWPRLDPMIKKWIQSLKTSVRLYLASEKQLCDQVFEEFESAKLKCFIEISKSSMWQVLDFVEAICTGSAEPEKLFRILDMYEVLTDLIPNIDALFSGEPRCLFQMEYREAINRLGCCVKRTFLKFESAVRWEPSTNPFAQGGIHHLTRYVMNYIKIVLEYEDTLNLILKEDDMTVVCPNMIPIREQDEDTSDNVQPLAQQLRIVISSLEYNLHLKANLYTDISLNHLFLMNNIHYMVQKIKDSDLRIIFGDPWLKRQIGKFQLQAREYKRATWGSVLDLLRSEPGGGARPVSKKILRERFRSFILAFEEVYKIQTGWLIPDLQLRDEVQISVSGLVIQVYRSFLERHYNQLDVGGYFGKRIKYSTDDLANHLLELFEGSSKSLH